MIILKTSQSRRQTGNDACLQLLLVSKEGRSRFSVQESWSHEDSTWRILDGLQSDSAKRSTGQAHPRHLLVMASGAYMAMSTMRRQEEASTRQESPTGATALECQVQLSCATPRRATTRGTLLDFHPLHPLSTRAFDSLNSAIRRRR